jgi:hypothetical protein
MFTHNNNNTNPPKREQQQRTLFGFCADAVSLFVSLRLGVNLLESFSESPLETIFYFWGRIYLRDLCGKNQQQHSSSSSSQQQHSNGRCLVFARTLFGYLSH